MIKPMPYYSVPDDVLEDPEQLREWASISIDAARVAESTKKKKRKK